MYKIKTAKFEGPLDLLLQLIEKTELDITEVALAEVTEQFMSHVEEVEEKKPEEVADFLVIASRLLLIKSRVLLPAVVASEDEDEIILETQLRIYKEFFEASRKLEDILLSGQFLYARDKILIKVDKIFNPPKDITSDKMGQIFAGVVAKLEPVVKLPEKNIKRVISIKERINNIRNKLLEKIKVNFSELVGSSQNKADLIVTFLGVLELVKQQEAVASQDNKFGEIVIQKNNES